MAQRAGQAHWLIKNKDNNNVSVCLSVCVSRLWGSNCVCVCVCHKANGPKPKLDKWVCDVPCPTVPISTVSQPVDQRSQPNCLALPLYLSLSLSLSLRAHFLLPSPRGGQGGDAHSQDTFAIYFKCQAISIAIFETWMNEWMNEWHSSVLKVFYTLHTHTHTLHTPCPCLWYCLGFLCTRQGIIRPNAVGKLVWFLPHFNSFL